MRDLSYGLAPFMPSDPEGTLKAKAYRLALHSSALCSRPGPTLAALRRMLRYVNSYYSNLIEGQGTLPADIERASREQLDARDTDARILIAAAVSEVDDSLPQMLETQAPTSSAFICAVHAAIYTRLPQAECVVKDENGQPARELIPGELRRNDVTVGRHIPMPGAEEVPGALQMFAEQYSLDRPALQGDTAVLAAAAAHHRLLWIHPFLDGNGRMARLFSQAYLIRALQHVPVWSLPRGLARTRQTYYARLAGADAVRQGDHDGRGARSLAGLDAFCHYFLDTCLDQVDYMTTVLDLPGFKKRLQRFVERAAAGELPDAPILDNGAVPVLVALFTQGELTRGEAARLTGFKERKAREVVSRILDAELAISDSHRAPIRPNYPADYLEDLFPKMGSVPTGI